MLRGRESEKERQKQQKSAREAIALADSTLVGHLITGGGPRA